MGRKKREPSTSLTGAGDQGAAAEVEVIDLGGQRTAGESREPADTPENSEPDTRGHADAPIDLEAYEKAADVWGRVWRRFAEKRRKEGASAAWNQLQYDMAMNAKALSPHVISGKDFGAMLLDYEERIKNEGATRHQDAGEAVASWLRGDDKAMKVQ